MFKTLFANSFSLDLCTHHCTFYRHLKLIIHYMYTHWEIASLSQKKAIHTI